MEVPLAIVRASAAQLPRLEASESLLAVQRASAGSGWMPPDAFRSLTAGWQRLADGAPAAEARARPEASADELAAIGIRVQMVAPAPPAEAARDD